MFYIKSLPALLLLCVVPSRALVAVFYIMFDEFEAVALIMMFLALRRAKRRRDEEELPHCTDTAIHIK